MSFGRTITTLVFGTLAATSLHCKDEGGGDGGSGSSGDGGMTDEAGSDETAGSLCGNGAMDGFEACDDGNTINGDGCNADCTVSQTMEWSSVWDSGAGADCALGIAVDSGSNVVAAGYAESGAATGVDIWLRKLDPDGNELWLSMIDGPSSAEDRARAVAVGPDDSIVVAGYVTGDAVAGREIFVGKYGPDGSEIWTDAVNGMYDTGDDSAYGVTVLGDGSIVAAGELAIADQDNDAWVRKYDADGNELWTYTHQGDGQALDSARAVTGGPNGDVFVTGWDTTGDGGRRTWTVKLAGANGAETWVQTYTAGAINGNTGFGIDAYAAGGVVVTGQQRTGTSTVDAWTRSYDGDGNEGFTDVFAGVLFDGGADIGHGVGIGSDEVAAVVGTFVNSDANNIFLRKLAPDGTEQWTEAITGDSKAEAEGWAVAIDPSNDHIVIGGCQADGGDTTSGDAFILKYTP